MAMTTLKPFDRITVDPNIMNGRPCIRGMRVQVSLILSLGKGDGRGTRLRK